MSQAEQTLLRVMEQILPDLRPSRMRAPKTASALQRKIGGRSAKPRTLRPDPPSEAFIIAVKSLIDERLLVLVRTGSLGELTKGAPPGPGEFAPLPDANGLLSIQEFSSRLQVSDQTVRNREDQGEFFSVLAPARKRGREYPAFQLLDGVRGEPLKQTIAELKDLGGAAKFQFFTTPNDLLGGLTPIRLLVKEQIPSGSDRAVVLLRQSDQARLNTVLTSAKTYASELSAA
jgi:hypothetical protein